MKRILLFTALAGLIAALAACNPEKKSKTVVLYYSQNGATRAVAEEMASRLGAEIAEIVPVNLYDGDFAATIERGKKELDEGVLPEIQPLKVKLEAYETVFLGYPIWFGTYAPPVSTLLASGALNGKKIVPFCTFGSGGLSSSVEKLKKALPDAEILPGYGVRAARIEAMPAEVDRFLKAGGFIEGTVEPLPEFPALHPVREEESAIFDAAVDGYPMLHARAVSVAVREVPGGKEYQFSAIDLPRDDEPRKLTGISPKESVKADEKAPSKHDGISPKSPLQAGEKAPSKLAGPIRVFVLALDGQAPVFTEVVR